uniref:Uncharacterized protein n=1 Tax=Anguilla anguilla TaxID=7936 RepID=A0A0E9XDU3_ANGAN
MRRFCISTVVTVFYF